MPAMTRTQSVLCRSAPWQFVARGVVLPWSLRGFSPTGRGLEVGAGSGAMAAALLDRYDALSLTATDVDAAMLDATSRRLSGFGARAVVQEADATALPFPDGAFDCAFSWAMLHHTIEWERALAELVRVVRPAGRIVGLDLLAAAPLRLIHRNDADNVRLMTLPDLRAALDGLPVTQVVLRPSAAGLLARFSLTRC